MAQAGKPALIVADYVQRFGDSSGRGSSREENVGMAAKGLKDLAREMGCPVLAPVQPNREYASRPDKEPKLADLRESGKLEQEADVVLGLFRPELHYPSGEFGVAEVSMLKNRSGVGDSPGTGARKLRWLDHKFGNYAP
jgi:replicative DNA helicase